MSKRFRDLNQNGVNFLLVDLDAAMTFMDVAQTSHVQETVWRNHNNARKAYDTVLRLLEKLTPDAEQRQEINAKLAVLKMRLEAAGSSFEI